MEAPGAGALVRDLAEDVAPVDLCGQIAALAAEQRPRLGHPLKQHHHLRIQGLQEPCASLSAALRLLDEAVSWRRIRTSKSHTTSGLAVQQTTDSSTRPHLLDKSVCRMRGHFEQPFYLGM